MQAVDPINATEIDKVHPSRHSPLGNSAWASAGGGPRASAWTGGCPHCNCCWCPLVRGWPVATTCTSRYPLRGWFSWYPMVGTVGHYFLIDQLIWSLSCLIRTLLFLAGSLHSAGVLLTISTGSAYNLVSRDTSARHDFQCSYKTLALVRPSNCPRSIHARQRRSDALWGTTAANLGNSLGCRGRVCGGVRAGGLRTRQCRW